MIQKKILWNSLRLLQIPAVVGLIVGIAQERTEHFIPGCAIVFMVWVTVQTGISAIAALVNFLKVLFYKKGLSNNSDNIECRVGVEYHTELALTYLLVTLLVALVGFSVCFGTSSLVEVIRNE